MKKPILTATLAAALFLSPTTSHATFPDVTEGYSEAVTYLTEQGIIGGYADGTFRPEQTITRVQAARMFMRHLQPSIDVEAFSFHDVLANHSDYDVIMQAASLGILNGTVQGNKKAFKPGHKLTRAQLAKAFVEAYDLELPEKKKMTTFSDVAADAWYKPYIDILVAHGLMNGYSDKTFKPNEPVKRKHFASIYYRYLTNDALTTRKPYVFGKVLDEATNIPISGAHIDVYDGEELYMTTTTDEDGAYRLQLLAGRYTLHIEQSGYDTVTRIVDANATKSVKQMAFLQHATLIESDIHYMIDSWGVTFELLAPVTHYTFSFPNMTTLHIEQDGELFVSLHAYETGHVPSFRGNWDILRENVNGYDYYIQQGGSAFGNDDAYSAQRLELFKTILKTATFH